MSGGIVGLLIELGPLEGWSPAVLEPRDRQFGWVSPDLLIPLRRAPRGLGASPGCGGYRRRYPGGGPRGARAKAGGRPSRRGRPQAAAPKAGRGPLGARGQGKAALRAFPVAPLPARESCQPFGPGRPTPG